MSSQDRTTDGLRILSLDSGGPGTYSQALILGEIENAMAKRFGHRTSSGLIRDHFDLIGGVGFGGLLAIMLGRLGMTTTQAKDGLLKVAQAIFPPGVAEPITNEERSKRLRESVESIVQEHRLPIDAKLYDEATGKPRCVVVVFTATLDDDRQALALETYKATGSSNLTIVEAACATISIPSFFAPVSVGPPMLRQSFTGGPRDCMNPALKLLDQSKSLFGREREILALISIGCGHPSFKSRPGSSDSSQQKQGYETKSSGMFLDVISSPGQVIRESFNKQKAKQAKSSKVVTGAIQLDPNIGWYAVDLMSSDCAETAKEVQGRFVASPSYIRINVEKEMTVLNLDDWTGLASIEEHTMTYIGQLKLGSDIPRLLETPKQTKEAARSVTKAPPRVSPTFVLRNAAYATMRRCLVDDRSTRQKIMVITGMGGCGKTQIVSYFLEENDLLYSHIIYADASSEESIKTDLEAWIQSIKGHEADDWQAALIHIRHTLRNEPWVLVLDNADDIKVDLAPLIPACNHGTILITSRNRNRGDLANTAQIELGVMTSEEAMEVLLLSTKRRAPLASEEHTAAQNILAELGYLPLAVSLAGSYCRQLSSNTPNPYTFGQYLATFRSERSCLMDREQVNPLDQYKQSVNTTIALSYGRMSDSEKEYLELFATFDGTDISLEIFSDAAKNEFKDPKQWMERPAEYEETLERLKKLFLASQKWNSLEIERAIATLTSNSLLSTTSITGRVHIHVHPLVQSWVCDRRDQTQSSQYTLMAAQVLTACNQDENPRLDRAMLPHIQSLRTSGKVAGLHINSRMAFVWTLEERGYYELAAEYCAVAYKELQDTLGSKDLVMLEAASELGWIYYLQGHYKNALELQLEVWEKRKEMLGMDHAHTIMSANNLALTYGKLGCHRDALQLQLEVWEKRKEILGVDHSDTLTSGNNLALTYMNLCRLQDALQLQLEVWEKRKVISGMDHPETLISADNLAITYRSLGRFQDALQLQLEVWGKWKTILGTDHPSTLISADNLAVTYRDLGRLQDALQLQLEVWEKRKGILGVDHPDTLTSGDNLAFTYQDLGRFQDALQLQLEVWEKWKVILGTNHPSTLVSANNLALTYRRLGRLQDALWLQLEVWEKRKEVLGVNHLDTINSGDDLALTYRGLGRFQDALRLQLDVWKKRKEISGTDHPGTLVSADNLAVTYRDLGRFQDALQIQLEVWEKLKERLGADHLDTLVSSSNLALVYRDLGRLQDALQLQLDVWKKQKLISGVDHPETLTRASDLAYTYGRLGRHQDALQLQSEVWEKRKEILGADHSDTLISGNDLAITYQDLGRLQEALQLQLEVCEKRKMISGVDHPETLTCIENLALLYEDLGSHQKAQELQLGVWEKRKQILPVNHPNTLWSGFHLAYIYARQGPRKRAFPLFREILALQMAIVGPKHPDTQLMIKRASFFGFKMDNS